MRPYKGNPVRIRCLALAGFGGLDEDFDGVVVADCVDVVDVFLRVGDSCGFGFLEEAEGFAVVATAGSEDCAGKVGFGSCA